jgi:hypothetical protein
MAQGLLLGLGIHQANEIRLTLAPRENEVMKNDSIGIEVCTEADPDCGENDHRCPQAARDASLSMQSGLTSDDRLPRSAD